MTADARHGGPEHASLMTVIRALGKVYDRAWWTVFLLWAAAFFAGWILHWHNAPRWHYWLYFPVLAVSYFLILVITGMLRKAGTS